MPAAGEHVHRLDGLDGETAGGEELDVTSQGGWIAGDVDHAPGTGGKDSVNDLRLAALAGRVHDQAVDRLTL